MKNKINNYCLIILILFSFLSCARFDPRPEMLENNTKRPIEQKTNIDDALIQLGRMTKIYNTKNLVIVCNNINDKTGTSLATGAEIPRDITLISKNTISRVGGNVYLSGISHNQTKTNMSFRPTVILQGGITGFDRGLETRSANTDFSLKAQIVNNVTNFIPSKFLGIGVENGKKSSQALIVLDYCFIELKKNIGLPGVSNKIDVYKGIDETELAFHLVGDTFGFKGNVKKIEGRHEATRLLVQFSIFQVIGRYLNLPYWNLLDWCKEDRFVLNSVKENFINFEPKKKILKIQELLFLHGYDIDLTAKLDNQTKAALIKHTHKKQISLVEAYESLYYHLPVSDVTLKRRETFVAMVKNMLAKSRKQKIVKKEISSKIRNHLQKSEQYLTSALKYYMNGDIYLSIKYADKLIALKTNQEQMAVTLKKNILIVKELYDQSFKAYFQSHWLEAKRLWKKVMEINRQIVGGDEGFFYKDVNPYYKRCIHFQNQHKDIHQDTPQYSLSYCMPH